MGDTLLTQTCNRPPKPPISIGEKGAETYFSEGSNLSLLIGSVKDRGFGKGKTNRDQQGKVPQGRPSSVTLTRSCTLSAFATGNWSFAGGS